ncbi:MAG: hypothetical protein GWO41_02415 [candidate division Zixibacteria bacterium]|nr:hypothetical protein [candidate division Zixibacteria bacterium]NIT51619.1 hypothetical protein [candidate division Zixibacteria bacterium]NIU07983.1 hypothetical protein [Phycisphaerae bacterium]NIW39491.1 hypothetical protein [candidate division Zixibacteria bacterium]
MDTADSYSKLESLYKKLYLLAEKLEEYALKAQAGKSELKNLHFQSYKLKDEALHNWLEVKKKADDSD